MSCFEMYINEREKEQPKHKKIHFSKINFYFQGKSFTADTCMENKNADFPT